jgi:hypothetical protein
LANIGSAHGFNAPPVTMGFVHTETDNPQTSTVPKVVPTINPGGSRTERIRHQKKANHKAGCDSFQEAISTAKDDKNELVLQGLVNKHIHTFPPERVSHVLDAHEIENDTNLNELQHNAAYHNECLIRNLVAHYMKSWDINARAMRGHNHSCRCKRTSRHLHKPKYGISL